MRFIIDSGDLRWPNSWSPGSRDNLPFLFSLVTQTLTSFCPHMTAAIPFICLRGCLCRLHFLPTGKFSTSVLCPSASHLRLIAQGFRFCFQLGPCGFQKTVFTDGISVLSGLLTLVSVAIPYSLGHPTVCDSVKLSEIHWV